MESLITLSKQAGFLALNSIHNEDLGTQRAFVPRCDWVWDEGPVVLLCSAQLWFNCPSLVDVEFPAAAASLSSGCSDEGSEPEVTHMFRVSQGILASDRLWKCAKKFKFACDWLKCKWAQPGCRVWIVRPALNTSNDSVRSHFSAVGIAATADLTAQFPGMTERRQLTSKLVGQAFAVNCELSLHHPQEWFLADSNAVLKPVWATSEAQQLVGVPQLGFGGSKRCFASILDTWPRSFYQKQRMRWLQLGLDRRTDT